MSENMKHLRKLASIAVAMLVIYNLCVYNVPKSINTGTDIYLAIYLAFATLFWPIYFTVLLILCLYYFFYKNNRPFAINTILTMILVALFGVSSCFGVFNMMSH